MHMYFMLMFETVELLPVISLCVSIVIRISD